MDYNELDYNYNNTYDYSLVLKLWIDCSRYVMTLTRHLQEQEDEAVDEVAERQGFNPLTPLIQVQNVTSQTKTTSSLKKVTQYESVKEIKLFCV